MAQVRTRCLHALALALVAGCAAVRSSPPALDRPQQRPFIITFWCGPPLAELDDARAAEIAAAGFTVVGAPCEGPVNSELNLRALDVVHRYGLRMWIADRRLTPAATTVADWTTSLRSAVAAYGSHPALDGYVVADEPPAPDFDAVAAVVSALHGADPDRLAYVNLLPDYVPPDALGAASYEEYVERFIMTVHPSLLSYDYYPFGQEKDRSTFFANLATMRAAGLRHDLPFMPIVLVMPHGPYRDPSEAELAWQVHHALAYGARGISYFAYWTPPRRGEWNNRSGLIEDSHATEHYVQVMRLNRRVRTLAAALDRFRSIAVADALGEIGIPFPIGPIDAVAGGPITAGLFGDVSGELATLLVNRDYREAKTATLQLHSGVAMPYVLDTDSVSWKRAATLSFALPPGGACLLRWDAPRWSVT